MIKNKIMQYEKSLLNSGSLGFILVTNFEIELKYKINETCMILMF